MITGCFKTETSNNKNYYRGDRIYKIFRLKKPFLGINGMAVINTVQAVKTVLYSI